MRIDILTLFPNMMTMFFEESILKRAQKKGLVEIYFHDLHDYSLTKYGSVDDYPYGGAAGMVMAVPLTATLYMLIREWVNKRNALQKTATIDEKEAEA